ncbi:hypothetical protein NKI01_20550 [Mesorhizobium sp. M0815]|uniref:hypothetical protein n=1 Tax=Mesorhizobium sp. M0815 TaxID=2957005 RepID=UPI00333CB3DE
MNWLLICGSLIVITMLAYGLLTAELSQLVDCRRIAVNRLLSFWRATPPLENCNLGFVVASRHRGDGHADEKNAQGVASRSLVLLI